MSRRERLLLIIGLVLVAGFGFFYLIYSPKQAEYRQLSEQLSERQEQLTRMQQTANLSTRLETEFAELQGFITAVEAKLPTSKDVPSLLVQLERTTRAVGIDLLAIRPAELQPVVEGSATAAPARPGARAAAPRPGTRTPAPAAASTYSRFPIKLTMTASYAEVLRLMSVLQDFPRLIVVKRLTVAPKAVPDLSVDLDVETYVLRREAR
ncbi:MAG: type 4a pilus biogenesis protein PilO [bacterium]